MTDLYSKIQEYFTKNLGYDIKSCSLEPSRGVYPLYRVVVDDDDYAMVKVVDFTETTCTFTQHSKASIHNTADLTFDWQMFNIEKAEDVQERILITTEFLKYCDTLLSERASDFIEYLPSLYEFETSLYEMQEICDHILRLQNILLEDRVSLIKNHKDEVDLETDIRSMTIGFTKTLKNAIENVENASSILITPKEQEEVAEELKELHGKLEFSGNYQIYKMDLALGYIGGKEQ